MLNEFICVFFSSFCCIQIVNSAEDATSAFCIQNAHTSLLPSVTSFLVFTRSHIANIEREANFISTIHSHCGKAY